MNDRQEHMTDLARRLEQGKELNVIRLKITPLLSILDKISQNEQYQSNFDTKLIPLIKIYLTQLELAISSNEPQVIEKFFGIYSTISIQSSLDALTQAGEEGEFKIEAVHKLSIFAKIAIEYFQTLNN